MGWSIAAVVISAAATAYSVTESNKQAYNAAERNNELIRQQHAKDLAAQKAKQGTDAQRAKVQDAENRAAIAGEEAEAKKRAASLEEEDSSDTLLTGSYGVKNALRRKTSIGV